MMRRLTWFVWLFAFFATFGFGPHLLTAGWPWEKVDPVSGFKKGSPEYYSYYAAIPPGSTRQFKHGMVWPPEQRPDGPERLFFQQYHAAKYWPYPYNIQDRAVTHDALDMQVTAGWKAASTLFDYHFNADTQELNSAGREQLKWIIGNAPAQHRQAFVASSYDKGINDARLSTVTNELSVMGAAEIPVMLRVAGPIGRSALEVDTYQKSYRENMPAPHIQYTSPSASGGSDSGS
ncbi:hypothetical protein [Lacunimicrobium album]